MLKYIGTLVLAAMIGAFGLGLGSTAHAWVDRSVSPFETQSVAQRNVGLWGGCDAAMMTVC